MAARRRGPGGVGRFAPGLALAVWAGVAPGCAAWDKAFHHHQGPSDAVEASEVPAVSPGPAVPTDVQRALALADAGRPEVALALLDAALKSETVPEDEGLYWVGVLRLSPPISDRTGARKALADLVRLHPDGARGHAAATLLGLLDQVDSLGAENASLQKDLKRLLDIDVEAQRKRQGGAAAPATP
jgi:hypothetical protein